MDIIVKLNIVSHKQSGKKIASKLFHFQTKRANKLVPNRAQNAINNNGTAGSKKTRAKPCAKRN
jgi:plasmid replication initiation protein